MSARVATRRILAVQRCIDRARAELQTAGENFDEDFTRQDAAILNLIRACDMSIDLANMLVRRHRLGIPEESRDSFRLLKRAGLLDAALSSRLEKMVGFRNLAVYQYIELSMAAVREVIARSSDDLLAFAELARQRLVTENDADA